MSTARCTACGYCMPCPAGVNIPKNFAILNNMSMESSRVMRWMVKRGYRNLVGTKGKLDRVDANGNASMCVRCGQCLEKCPQEIAIPDELERVHAILGKRERMSRHYSRSVEGATVRPLGKWSPWDTTANSETNE